MYTLKVWEEITGKICRLAKTKDGLQVTLCFMVLIQLPYRAELARKLRQNIGRRAGILRRDDGYSVRIIDDYPQKGNGNSIGRRFRGGVRLPCF